MSMSKVIALIQTTRRGIAASIARNGFISDETVQAIEKATVSKLASWYPPHPQSPYQRNRLALIATRISLSALPILEEAAHA